MTAAVLQMQGRRSASFSKPQKQGKARKAQLPAIAPRYQLVSDPDAFGKTDPTVNASVNVPRTRLPPRSRFGCWWVFLHLSVCEALWLTFGTQDMSGNYVLGRPELLYASSLTDMPADTQGQVGLPSDVFILQYQPPFTHLLFYFLDVMKRGPNAQYVGHASTPYTIDTIKC